MAGKDLEASCERYEQLRPKYERMAERVKALLRQLLEAAEVACQHLQCRGKEVESFREKAKRDKYSDPLVEIHDMAGVRVIVYIERDVAQVLDIIEQEFDVDYQNSDSRHAKAQPGKFGYRGLNYVCRLASSRGALPEWAEFADMRCEIQVTTVLAHAWAEIEHDSVYKAGMRVPGDIQHKFAQLAALLEKADEDLDEASGAMGRYRAELPDRMAKGDLDIEIDTIALQEYVKSRFAGALEAGLEPRFRHATREQWAFGLLEYFGISTLAQLDSPDLQQLFASPGAIAKTDLHGFVVAALMLRDAKELFEVTMPAVTGRGEPFPMLREQAEEFRQHDIDMDGLRAEGLVRLRE